MSLTFVGGDVLGDAQRFQAATQPPVPIVPLLTG